MSTNSRFVIAIHIVTLLASSTEPVPSPRLASSIGVNAVTVRRVVLLLREAGMVHTVLGSSGGVTLAGKASSLTLRAVYLGVREDSIFGAFPDAPNPECLVGRHVQHVLEGVIADTEQQMFAPLAEVTIADMVLQVQRREEDQAQ